MTLINNLLRELNESIEEFMIDSDTVCMERLKLLSELSVFIGFCNDSNQFATNTDLTSINNRIYESLSRINSNQIFKNFYYSTHLIYPYLSIRKISKIPKFESFISLILEHNLFPSELPPHRQMEWDHIKLKLGMVDHVNVPANSILKNRVYSRYFNRELTYSYTHTLLYLFDFGHSDVKPDAINYKKAKYQIECLLMKYYGENDIDIFLELCVNYFSLAPYIKIDASILRHLEVLLDTNDFVQFDWLKNDVFKYKYHSFLVLGLLDVLLVHYKNNHPTVYAQLCPEINKTQIFNTSQIKINSLHSPIEKFSFYKKWDLLKRSFRKEFIEEDFKDLSDIISKNEFLRLDIIENVKIMIERNQSNILWDSEFSHMDLSESNTLQVIKESSLCLKKIFAYLINLKGMHQSLEHYSCK